ncbi:putative germin-like protein 2-1 [Beta vulgaris subsp. vulgaris]|uniref:putative germin-like protein 2-1 n=1 Tax=Beta vulgaris subsp. vulgaris TaxID=3555 RepID=UPI002036C33F|nr:putative germin-like protein 2-1 [Beta vulgaris subsp. vulgaris]
MEDFKGGRIAKLVMMFVYCMAFAMNFMFHVSIASDPAPLQDFCIAVNDPNSAVLVNGNHCKNPKEVTIDDFLYKGFNIPADTNNTQGASATLVDITRFPAVNTQGVSMARVDFAPYGLNTPHLHPRGSEVFAVMEGIMYAGFVTTDYKLYDTILKKGDIIVFPQGLIHFQLNLGKTDALAIASFGSQNPGRINIAESVFGTNPRVLDEVLTKGFQVDELLVKQLRSQFSTDNIYTSTGRSFFKLLSETY